jgi:hypothetical protein
MIGLSPRLSLGGHTAHRLAGDATFLAEVGPVLQLDDARVGLQTSELLEIMGHFNLYARQQWFLGDYSAGTEVRSTPVLSNPIGCYGDPIPGRPLRTSDRRIIVGTLRTPAAASSGTRERAGRRWQEDAAHECASVRAFLQLARDLLAAEAPEALVNRALDAAEDEMMHAAMCADVARKLSGVGWWPVLPRVDRPSPRDRSAQLARLARESFEDGCLNEGTAARVAAGAARSATDPAIRSVLQRIAIDEARHAELAWDVLAWTAEECDADLREQLRHDGESSPIARRPKLAEDLEVHGQLSAEAAAHHASAVRETGRERLALLLDRR